MDHIANIRKEYSKTTLDVKQVNANPLEQFKKWMNEAIKSEVNEPTAMTLSTATKEGVPSSRTVLLKDVSERNTFVFYTNYNSQKGRQLTENPYAALTFFWPELERQVNIQGAVKKTTPEVSDEYFESRPWKSKIGAWASKQSEALSSRNKLMQEFAKLAIQFSYKKVSRPPYWGGFELSPKSIEFWQGRESRLHDRIHFQLVGGNEWKVLRLSP